MKSELEQMAADTNSHGAVISIPKAEETLPNKKGGGLVLKDVISTSNRIVSKLQGLVQASRRRTGKVGRKGRSINSSRLTRILSGDTRIFNSKSDRREPNTAVHLLVDMSGSMTNDVVDHKSGCVRTYSDVAQRAAVAIGLALEVIPGVSPAITAFGSCLTNPVRSIIKHGESVKRQPEKLAVSHGGFTPLAEAMWYAAFELSKVREDRKMVVVITDGEPDCSLSFRESIEMCEQRGVEMVGIGIVNPSIKHYIKNSIVINDINDLQGTLFDLVGQSLVSA